jgi:hypothetical protein
MDFDPEKHAVVEALVAFVEAFNNLDWEQYFPFRPRALIVRATYSCVAEARR